MKYPKLAWIILTTFFLFGCAGSYAEPKISGPFVTYTHETFTTREAGETGLFIDGEDWYSLVDLKGFFDLNQVFVSPYQFLFYASDRIRLSVFAEQLPGVVDSESCLNHHVSRGNQTSLGGKRVGIDENNVITSIWYRPYYKGYCFNFHFSTDRLLPVVDEIVKIIKSVRFVDGHFSNADVNKLIYYGNKRIKISIPDSWRISFHGRNKNSLSAIKLQPMEEGGFDVLMAFLRPNKDAVPEQAQMKLKNITIGDMSEAETYSEDSDAKPEIQEFSGKRSAGYYFISSVHHKNALPLEKRWASFLIMGNVTIDDGSLVRFKIFSTERYMDIGKRLLSIIDRIAIVSLPFPPQ